MTTYSKIAKKVDKERIATTKVKREEIAKKFQEKIRLLVASRTSWILNRLVQIEDLRSFEGHFASAFDNGASIEELDNLLTKLLRANFSGSEAAAALWQEIHDSEAKPLLMSVRFFGKGNTDEQDAQLNNKIVGKYRDQFSDPRLSVEPRG